MTGDLLYRTFTPDLEVRSAAQGGDGRTICGIAVPWGVKSHINDRLIEQFANGAFNGQIASKAPRKVRFANEHVKLGGVLIGKTLMLRNDAAGLYGEWRVSNTSAGDDALTLVADELLEHLSIGFLEGQNRRLAGGVIERVTATLTEVALTVEGAYGELAAVSAVRSAGGREHTRAAEAQELIAGVPDLRGGGMWAITSEAYERITAAMRSANPAEGKPDDVKAFGGPSPRRAGGVAVIPIRGTITPRQAGGLFGLLFGGGANIETLTRHLRAAVADDQVDAIVLDIDSPGGQAAGVPELADEIRAARARKPIVAIANGLAASAAYWLAAQATEVYVTPAGMVGSIGVFMAHEDWSKLDERIGVKTTLVFAGKHKTEGNPTEPLSDEARADWQSKVDDIYDMFVAGVAKGRGVKAADVRSGYGEGRTVLAAKAVSGGLANRVGTFDDAVRRANQLANGS